MKWLITTYLLLNASFHLSAQTQVGIFGGLSYYGGELAASNVDFSEMHFAYGLQYRYEISRYLSIRAGFHKGIISGSDANASEPVQRARNLHFRSNLSELQLVGEFSFFRILFNEGQQIIAPYLFGGLAVFYFNPKAFHNNEWIDLQPLGTEGQNIQGYPHKYKLIQTAIPLGAGIKFKINPMTTIGAEMGFRRTFTDYLDDVSTIYVEQATLIEYNGLLSAALSDRTIRNSLLEEDTLPGSKRGNPQTKDWYYFTGLSISINLDYHKKQRKVKLKI